MKKQLTIEACEDCPHLFGEECWRVPSHRIISVTGEIPEWCPLPDAPEREAKGT